MLKDLVKEHGSNRKAADALGVNESTVRYWLKKEEQGIPLSHRLKGESTLYDNAGNVKQKWVKTELDKQENDALLYAMAQAFAADIPKAKPVTQLSKTNDNLLSCYVLTDYHMGMLSWAGETGEDWDTDIAADLLIRWFAAAIKSTPDSSVGVLAQLGDFMHYDSLDAVTPMSGHILDADTRLPRIVNMVIKVLRQVIQMLLEKHEHVHVIMAEGNHDMASSVWLRALFAEKYEDEPRITVDNSHTPYYVVEHGKTSLFFHHGHKKRLKEISKTFAGMYREIFGRTTYSYAHMGHLHHVEAKEDSLMIVEQHPTLSAKDAYATRGGYLSMRGANVITYSKEAGEVSRITIRPEIVT